MAATIKVPGFQGNPPSRPSPSGSQDSREYEDYFSEMHDIEIGKDSDSPTEDDESKTPDEGENEATWLKDAGFAHLVTKFEEGKEIREDLLQKETSSLTRAQAAAVKKRVDTLNATVRKKQRTSGKTDVRDVFSSQTDVSYQADGSTGTPSDAHSGDWSRPKRDISIIKGRSTGGYSLSGGKTSLETGTVGGIETLSIQQKAGALVVSIPGEPYVASDGDVSLNFALDDGKSQSENYVLVKDPLGVTRINDLGKNDLAKLRHLALIEMTSLFDNHNITFTRRKAKRRLKENGVFGVPLQTLVENDQKKFPGTKVPRIFSELIEFLEKNGVEEEGILRVPGSVTRIKALREEIEDKFNSGHFRWDDIRANDAAGLLKQFLREQPVPLLTFEYYEAFAQVDAIPEQKQQLQAFTLLILLLPDVHRDTLKLLLKFLKHVVDHRENKMSLNNVAMIMAPNLFLVPSSKRKVKDIEIRMAAGTSSIVRMLLKYQDILWTVPAFMISQIRHQYETDHHKKSKDKSIMRFLHKKDKTEIYKKPIVHSETSFQEGVIRVQAPHLTKCYTAVQLDENTTAGDIVNKFRRKNMGIQPPAEVHNGRHGNDSKNVKEIGVFAKENTYLYECGGNIGERRLDHNTNMLALLRINPNAEWIIKNKPD